MKKHWKIVTVLLAGLFLLAGAAVASAQTETPSEADWYARYWNNMDQAGEPVLQRNEVAVSYDWGLGSPASAVNPNNFSARWTSPVYFDEGTYRFTLTSDDGARVWIDDEYIIDSWTQRPATTDVTTVHLDEGTHNIAVDYFEDGGYALISFAWQRVDGNVGGSGNGDTELTIDPLSGPAGTNVDVRATGFMPGSTVSVGIGRAGSETTSSFQAEIRADGTLETEITVPAEAQVGETWRVLVLGDEGARALSNGFTVISAAGEAGTCGATYVVQPNDWLSKIARNCNTTVEAILALNPAITNPNIIDVGTILNMPTSGETAPQVTITPESGPVGTTISVTATGFAPNEEVSVALRRPGELPFTGMPVTTDDEGRLEANIEIPDVAEPGQTLTVVVRSDEANAESEPFTVTSSAEVTATPRYNLNLRSGPNTDFEDIDVVPAGTEVPVLEVSPNGNWIRVRYDGMDGWIASWLSDIVGSLANVPQQTSQTQ